MKRKKRKQGDVELNLAAMLDMAFQLLTFFILTFKPAPVEGQVLLRMPPPQPIAGGRAGEFAGNDAQNTNPLAALNTLVVSAIANDGGSLKQLAVGDAPLGSSFAALDRKLGEVLATEGSAFNQVIIQADSRLRYDELMRVVEVCTRQKLSDGQPLTKISFVEGA